MSPSNPVGGTGLINAARADVNRVLASAQRWLIAQLQAIPVAARTINAAPPGAPLVVNADVYDYNVSLFTLQMITSELKNRLGGTSEPVVNRTVSGYEVGTAQEIASLAAMTSEYTRTITQVLTSDPWQRRVALVRARVFEQMDGFVGETAADLSRVLMQGIENGQNPLIVAKDIKARFDVSKGRAERIARTEITGALRRAHWDEADSAREQLGIRTLEMHLSALSPTTRESHARRHGRLYTTQEVREWYTQDGNGINCYLPGTRVRGRFVAGSKAHYAGNAIRIVTASGRNLAVTPNHPVMTDRGLVAADKIAKGDNLIAYSAEEENLAGVRDLNGELADSAIEDVFGALVKVGHSFNRRVRGIDFHGDGEFCNENVEIVDSASVLPYGIDSTGSKLLDNLGLVKADLVSRSLCAFFFARNGVDLPAPLFVRFFRKLLPIFWRSLCHSFKRAIGAVAVFKTGSIKPPIERDSGYPSLAAYLKNGLSRLVLRVKVGHIKSRFTSSDFSPVNPGGLEDSPHRALRDSNIVRNCLHAFPGLISFDKVVSVESFHYCGHVYDLQEVSGIMIAQGIISSNCKCTQVSMLVDKDGKPLQERLIVKAADQRKRYESQSQ